MKNLTNTEAQLKKVLLTKKGVFGRSQKGDSLYF